MGVALFDFYDYADALVALVKEFGELQEVSFQPTREDVLTHFKDLSLPAFLMAFDDPNVADMSTTNSMRVTDEGKFMPLEVNLVGYLVLPWVAGANPHIPDVNSCHALAQATCNIAQKISSGAGGLNAGLPRIDSIQFGETDDYLVGTVRWSHGAIIGKHADNLEYTPQKLFGRFNPCPDMQLTVEPKLVSENPDETHTAITKESDLTP